MKFSALNVDFSSLKSRPWKFKEASAVGRQRRLPPPSHKSDYFTAVISCSVKTVVDRQRHAAYHNILTDGVT